MEANYVDYIDYEANYDSPSYSTYSGSPAPADQPYLAYQTYPMTRYTSSTGSSHLSSGPNSPANSGYYVTSGSPTSAPSFPPYYDPSLSTSPSPYPTSPYSARDYSSSTGGQRGARASRCVNNILHLPIQVLTSHHSSSSNPTTAEEVYCCLWPGCEATPFKRPADLNRHYNCHIPDKKKESIPCDYPRCPRSSKPFTRHDHYREHLREYHKEDIEKRNVKQDEGWYRDRNTQRGWWRCQRCLQRVAIDSHGFECPDCKNACPTARREARQR